MKHSMKNVFVLLIVSCLTTVGRGDLIGHFPLDSDGNDVVAGYEGDVPDSVAFVEGGVVGGAAEFEGFEGIQIPYEEGLNPEGSFSLTAWVNPSDTAGWNSVITSRSHSGVDEGVDSQVSGYIIYNSPDNFWHSWVGTGGAPGAWGPVAGQEAELDEWTHLAVSYDAENDVRILYVNGEEDAIGEDLGYLQNPDNPLTIGAGGDTGGEFFFVGLIDDVSIWDEVLDEAAINAIMNDGVAAFAAGGGGTPGDFNNDGTLDALDIDALSSEILTGGAGAAFDVNGDGDVDAGDRTHWVETLANTWFGDSNLDGEFNSSDFVAVFTAGQYEDGVPQNSTWATGDWDGDGDFSSGDFVAAFSAGGFEVGPRENAAAASVPEPTSVVLLCFGLCGLLRLARRN